MRRVFLPANLLIFTESLEILPPLRFPRFPARKIISKNYLSYESKYGVLSYIDMDIEEYAQTQSEGEITIQRVYEEPYLSDESKHGVRSNNP